MVRESPVPRYTSILTAGPWRQFAYWRYIRVSATVIDTVDELAAMMPCASDNIFRFVCTTSSSSGDMLIDEGPTKCDSSMPQQPRPLWWNIPYSHGTSFIISDGNIADHYSLDYISDTVLRLSQGETYDPMRGDVESHVLVYRRLH